MQGSNFGNTVYGIRNKEIGNGVSIFEEEHPFLVTWSHYLQLMRIENEDERSFYEMEAVREKWGVREWRVASRSQRNL